MGDISPGAGVALGIIVGLLSTCVQSVGLTLQRKSHMLEDSKEDLESRRAPYRRRRWQIGMFLFLLANIVGSTIQITTLPLPLLSTLQASGLVFNSIMASLILKEQWTWRTLAGTVLVAGGAILISFFSALPEPSHNLRQLLDLLGMRSFLLWFILSLLFALGVLVMDFSLRHFIAERKRESPKILLIRGMAYGLLSGILSAHALLLAKSAVELIVRSLADKVNQFSSYQSWLLLLAFLVLALTQLYYLHLGLKLVSTSVLYPFVFCIYNIVAILDGLIYFRQMDRLPPLHAGLIALGTVILLSGVLALSWRLEDEQGTDDECRHHMAQSEIPQTVLLPGSGFVGDPDTDTASSAPTDDEAGINDMDGEDNGERSPLLSHGRTHRASSMSTRRRKRASTLKEVISIWEEPGDGNDSSPDNHYNTFTRPRSSTAGRPASASAKRLPNDRRRSSEAVADEGGDADTEDPQPSMQRSSTMPSRSRSGRRRRHSTHMHGNAPFSDLLRLEWWRSKRRKDGHDQEDDEGDGVPTLEQLEGYLAQGSLDFEPVMRENKSKDFPLQVYLRHVEEWQQVDDEIRHLAADKLWRARQVLIGKQRSDPKSDDEKAKNDTPFPGSPVACLDGRCLLIELLLLFLLAFSAVGVFAEPTTTRLRCAGGVCGEESKARQGVEGPHDWRMKGFRVVDEGAGKMIKAVVERGEWDLEEGEMDDSAAEAYGRSHGW